MMYQKILVPIDNSEYSNYCTDVAVLLASRMKAQLTGSHVYSGGLHDRRFKDMEGGLPACYQQEERLTKSRTMHNSLIIEGLRAISSAYLDPFQKKCLEAGVSFECKVTEGKNWVELVRDARDSRYDLIIMGILGLGTVNGSLIGGVCERVTRKVNTDVLVVKDSRAIHDRVVAAIDGSPHSFLAFKKALGLAKLFGLSVEAVSVYDPHFHRKAFKALTGVLSDEAGKNFCFRDQERLHDEIIDDGLGKIYQGYLDEAAAAGAREGVEVKTELLSGKAYHEICKYLLAAPPSLLVISRFGAHRVEEADIGNTAENLLRLAPCNVLMTDRSVA